MIPGEKIPEGNVVNNIKRFSGFEGEYNRHRPTPPQTIVKILTAYLERNPGIVLDLGCGTGLSSFIWQNHARKVIGIEPNNDMRREAQETLAGKEDGEHISFVAGYSNQLKVKSGVVDIVTCSQSFHWMEPVSTLKEVSRVLCDGGIFAAYDCDWPPTINWKIEKCYNQLMTEVDELIAKRGEKDSFVQRWPKDEHLKNIRESQAFQFSKEVLFHSVETCDAARYIGLAFSQGGLQTVLKSGWTDLDERIESFKRTVEGYFGERTLDLLFSYRMRMGIK